MALLVPELLLVVLLSPFSDTVKQLDLTGGTLDPETHNAAANDITGKAARLPLCASHWVSGAFSATRVG